MQHIIYALLGTYRDALECIRLHQDDSVFIRDARVILTGHVQDLINRLSKASYGDADYNDAIGKLETVKDQFKALERQDYGQNA